MRKYLFSISGVIELDSDKIGIAAARDLLPESDNEQVVSLGLQLQLDPVKALNLLLQAGLLNKVIKGVIPPPWDIHAMTSEVDDVRPSIEKASGP